MLAGEASWFRWWLTSDPWGECLWIWLYGYRSCYLLQCRCTDWLTIRGRNWWSIRFVFSRIFNFNFIQFNISAGKSSLVEAVSGVRQQIVCPFISLFIFWLRYRLTSQEIAEHAQGDPTNHCHLLQPFSYSYTQMPYGMYNVQSCFIVVLHYHFTYRLRS